MLVIGLGNPGGEYTNTRHNIGFKAVDAIASRLNFSWKESAKFRALISSGLFNNKKIILAKPTTYMNLSGDAIALIKNYYNIFLNDVVVFHDELDISLGSIKYKIGGGSAGHNGIKSLDKHIGQGYHRIRIGIGRPENSIDVASYVLSNFTNEEKIVLEKILAHIENSFPKLIDGNFNTIVSNNI